MRSRRESRLRAALDSAFYHVEDETFLDMPMGAPGGAPRPALSLENPPRRQSSLRLLRRHRPSLRAQPLTDPAAPPPPPAR